MGLSGPTRWLELEVRTFAERRPGAGSGRQPLVDLPLIRAGSPPVISRTARFRPSPGSPTCTTRPIWSPWPPTLPARNWPASVPGIVAADQPTTSVPTLTSPDPGTDAATAIDPRRLCSVFPTTQRPTSRLISENVIAGLIDEAVASSEEHPPLRRDVMLNERDGRRPSRRCGRSAHRSVRPCRSGVHRCIAHHRSR